jgi:hypothetical protein
LQSAQSQRGLPAYSTKELVIQIQNWEVVLDEIPTRKLADAFRLAMKAHDPRAPFQACEVLRAWLAIPNDERMPPAPRQIEGPKLSPQELKDLVADLKKIFPNAKSLKQVIRSAAEAAKMTAVPVKTEDEVEAKRRQLKEQIAPLVAEESESKANTGGAA